MHFYFQLSILSFSFPKLMEYNDDMPSIWVTLSNNLYSRSSAYLMSSKLICLIENRSPSLIPDHWGFTDTTALVVSSMYRTLQFCNIERKQLLHDTASQHFVYFLIFFMQRVFHVWAPVVGMSQTEGFNAFEWCNSQ